jgi:hypothetical protein
VLDSRKAVEGTALQLCPEPHQGSMVAAIPSCCCDPGAQLPGHARGACCAAPISIIAVGSVMPLRALCTLRTSPLNGMASIAARAVTATQGHAHVLPIPMPMPIPYPCPTRQHPMPNKLNFPHILILFSSRP